MHHVEGNFCLCHQVSWGPVWAKLISGAEVKASTFELSLTSENLRNPEVKFYWEVSWVHLIKGKCFFSPEQYNSPAVCALNVKTAGEVLNRRGDR